MIRYERQILTVFSIIFFLGILIYGGFKLLPIVTGPKINISSPENGAIISDTTLKIRGSTERVTRLIVNGSKVDLDKEGNFETNLAIWRGHTILVIEGYDRFGRKVSITKNIGTN
jgi:hypothetical protein